ncbi:transposase [Allobaculum mucilyticum]|nr:transposase [Allobaculum mucilyticum]
MPAGEFESHQKVFPKLFRGYQIKESLRAIFRSNEGVEEALKKWLSWASRCRIRSLSS